MSHMEALEKFISSGRLYGMIIEDDAQIVDVSNAQFEISVLLDFLSSEYTADVPIYIELSESFSYEAMRATNLLNVRTDSFLTEVSVRNRVYQPLKPFPNTTCAYLLNTEMAKAMLKDLRFSLQSKRYRTLPVDWVYLKYFMKTKRENVVNLHVVPGVFKQGSIHNISKN